MVLILLQFMMVKVLLIQLALRMEFLVSHFVCPVIPSKGLQLFLTNGMYTETHFRQLLMGELPIKPTMSLVGF